VKKVLFTLILGLSNISYAQNIAQQVWLETSLKCPISKRWSCASELNQRYDSYGLTTFFPQISIKCKLKKWLRPSIDYRWIMSRSYLDPYTSSHRINGNLEVALAKKRFDLGLRVRYQHVFSRNIASYDSEFDQCWRLKLACGYDINHFLLSPMFSAEVFYDPMNHPQGRQFTRIRCFGGFNFDLNSNHKLSAGMYLDQWINSAPKSRLMYVFSYGYTLGKN